MLQEANNIHEPILFSEERERGNLVDGMRNDPRVLSSPGVVYLLLYLAPVYRHTRLPPPSPFHLINYSDILFCICILAKHGIEIDTTVNQPINIRRLSVRLIAIAIPGGYF